MPANKNLLNMAGHEQATCQAQHDNNAVIWVHQGRIQARPCQGSADVFYENGL